MNTGKDSNTYFENPYLRLREKENRILSDDQIALLPYLSKGPHSNEWNLRAKSSKRFTSYLKNQPNLASIIEIGCGNGWFTNQISTNTSANVYGIDINHTEIEQAKRLFTNKKTTFIEFDIQHSAWKGPSPDIVVFNASIQYFPSLSKILNLILSILNPSGQIHLIDSPIYSMRNVGAAKNRSLNYFRRLEVPEMTEHYFHHTMEELATFRPTYLYRPHRFPLNKFLKDSPFPWMKINKANE